MSKEMAVIALGVWVVVMPYLGIYRSWLTVLMVLTGVGLMIIGFLLRGEVLAKEQRTNHKSAHRTRKARMPFEENTPVIEVVEQDHSSGDSSIGSLN